MGHLWLHDIEALEAITQNESTRALFLRMSALSQAGRLDPFLSAVVRDDDLDEETKEGVVELAQDRAFLLAVEDYVRRTRRCH
jgi:hypothetical protein